MEGFLATSFDSGRCPPPPEQGFGHGVAQYSKGVGFGGSALMAGGGGVDEFVWGLISLNYGWFGDALTVL